MRRVREYANPIHDIKHSSAKLIKRDRSEWVGVKVPAIISKALFDKVQERIAWNQKHYRNPRVIQLLSSMIRCGCCGSSVFAYKGYCKDRRTKELKVYHRVSYKCNYKYRQSLHVKDTMPKKCTNKEINAKILEPKILSMLEENLLSPDTLRPHMDFFKRRIQANQVKIEKQLKAIDQKIHKLTESKKRIVELYALGELERDSYTTKNLEYDNEVNKLKIEKVELMRKIPLLHKKQILDVSIKQYCDNAKTRFERCTDFETRRQFILDYIEKIIYENERVEIHGSVPIKLKANKDTDTELAKIEFYIKGTLTRSRFENHLNNKKYHSSGIF